jgi:ribonuclease HI
MFSDGACSSNGRKGAKAGFGLSVGLIGTVYRELAHFASPLQESESQTNQRAELRGVHKAWSVATTELPALLHRVGKTADRVHIYTDSQYSLDCLLKWAPAWSKKGWKKRDGDDVLHQDIIEPLFTAIKTWSGYPIEFHHVRSHTGKTDPISLGNARADELATSTIS